MIISYPFFITLLLSAVIYWRIPLQQHRNLFLSVSSLIFVYFISKPAFTVIISLSIFSFCAAYLIEKYQKSFIYWSSIAGIVALLAVFKYSELLAGIFSMLNLPSIFSLGFSFSQILLPLGLSYITFKHISYLTDIYWQTYGKGSFINFLCYSSLFTIFTAGPIERFNRFNEQITKKIEFEFINIETGIERIAFGLFKKLVIANWINYLFNPVKYYDTYPVLALLAFSIQLYMDFSGYSDIAIGSSRLFGIRIMENFNYPYFQPNIAAFWRCWHISLSEWIRDYIFFPLQCISRNKTWYIVAVPIISFAVCGLWHDATWNYLFWGLSHGAAIAVFQIWSILKKRFEFIKSISESRIFTVISTIITFAFVTISWKFLF